MPEYVLDTHTCVWALAAPRKLGKIARRVLEAHRDRVWVPAAVVAELALLRELGRVGIGLPELKVAIAAAESLCFLELGWDQLEIYSGLAGIRDPFDRLIVSAARARSAKLITKDEGLAESGLVEVVWS
jgi:PIN domain nuclease of toxin-antitoxin system